ncbi:MAG TPA: hypothetical protein VKS62_04045 [Methylomirabilota bacterium]|jgi:hypothetical protein|nr:hypothetical protein [Methylomirabilota bacterium]
MVMVQGVRRSRAGVALRLAIVAAAVTACGSLVKMEAPAADGPRISGLEVATARPMAGCPVRFKLHLDAGADDGMRAGIGWVRLDRRAWGSGREIVAIEPVPSGDAMVALAPRRPGVYACQVQVADRSGRWSNVLQTRIAVDAAPAGEASRCA